MSPMLMKFEKSDKKRFQYEGDAEDDSPSAIILR